MRRKLTEDGAKTGGSGIRCELYYIILYRIALYYFILLYIILLYIILYYMRYYINYAIPHYTVLYYTILQYSILYDIASSCIIIFYPDALYYTIIYRYITLRNII